MKRALTARNVLTTKFNTLGFDGVWRDAVGDPPRTGSWIIYGDTKNGKTTFAMMLSKYLTAFGRVAYNSVEEGNSRTIQMAVDRGGLLEAGGPRALDPGRAPGAAAAPRRRGRRRLSVRHGGGGARVPSSRGRGEAQAVGPSNNYCSAHVRLLLRAQSTIRLYIE